MNTSLENRPLWLGMGDPFAVCCGAKEEGRKRDAFASLNEDNDEENEHCQEQVSSSSVVDHTPESGILDDGDSSFRDWLHSPDAPGDIQASANHILEVVGSFRTVRVLSRDDLIDELVASGTPISQSRKIARILRQEMSRRQAPTAIFWDLENVSIPSGTTGRDAVARIKSAVRPYGNLMQFRGYAHIGLGLIPERKRSELQLSGCHLVDCPHQRRKEVADKMIIVDAMEFAHQHPEGATLCFITEDVDYTYLLSALAKQPNWKTVIISPRRRAKTILQSTCGVHLCWESIMPVKAKRSDKSSKKRSKEARTRGQDSIQTEVASPPRIKSLCTGEFIRLASSSKSRPKATVTRVTSPEAQPAFTAIACRLTSPTDQASINSSGNTNDQRLSAKGSFRHANALFSGACGATASCFAKFAFSASESSSSAPLISIAFGPSFRPSRYLCLAFLTQGVERIANIAPSTVAAHLTCPQVMDEWVPRGISLLLMIICNAIMLSSFLTAMQKSGSVAGTALSSAANFILSAAYGFLIFREGTEHESSDGLWLLGFTMVISGVVLIISGGSTAKAEQATEQRASKQKQK